VSNDFYALNTFDWFYLPWIVIADEIFRVLVNVVTIVELWTHFIAASNIFRT
jgi:hypothetical protein